MRREISGFIVGVLMVLLIGVGGYALDIVFDDEGYKVKIDGVWFNDAQKQRALSYDCVLDINENPSEIGFYGTEILIDGSCDESIGYETVKKLMQVGYGGMANQGRSNFGSELPVCIRGDDEIIYYIYINGQGNIAKAVDDGRCI